MATPTAAPRTGRNTGSVFGYCAILATAATLATGQLFGYLPLLPQLTETFGAGAKLGLPLFAAGYALGMLFIGSLAGSLGARKVIAVSLATGGVISGIIALSPGIEVLLTLRLVEGIALGGFPPAAFVASAQKVPPSKILFANSAMVFGLLGSAGVAGMISRTVLSAGSWRTVMAVYSVLLLATAGIAVLQQGIAAGRGSDIHPYLLLVKELSVRRIALGAACGAVTMAAFVTVNGVAQSGPHAVPALVIVVVIVLSLLGGAKLIVKQPADLRRLVGFVTTSAGAAVLLLDARFELVALAVTTVGATLMIPASIQLIVASARNSVPAAVATFTASLFVGGASAGLAVTGLVPVTVQEALVVILVLGCAATLAVIAAQRAESAGLREGKHV